jgi:ABC-2 type transport system permease protein
MTDAVRSEWIKLRTARSNLVLLILAATVPVALTLLLTITIPVTDLDGTDLFGLLLAGAHIGYILLGVLGVLVIGQEYRHTTIRVTFTADPKRARVMLAKAIVVAATGLFIGTCTTLLSYVLGNAVFTSRGLDITLEGGIQTRALAGSILLFALYGLVGLGLGAIIRATAGAITLLVVWPLIIEPIVGGIFPRVGRWLPFSAGEQLTSTSTTASVDVTDTLSPRAGGLLFAGFMVVVLVIGTLLVMRRDA